MFAACGPGGSSFVFRSYSSGKFGKTVARDVFCLTEKVSDEHYSGNERLKGTVKNFLERVCTSFIFPSPIDVIFILQLISRICPLHLLKNHLSFCKITDNN